MAPLLREEENDQLNQWLSMSNLGNVPRAPVNSPQPETPATPELAQTNRGAAIEDTGTIPDDSRIEDSNPGHTPQDLLGADIAQKTEQAGKYGPDQQQQVLDSIMKSHGSFRNRASRGLAGLGDAIMGVAGKQSPGFANMINEQDARSEKMQIESNPIMQAMNRNKMGAEEDLAGQTSASPLGASKAAPLAMLFRKFGVPEKDLPGILQNPAAARSVAEILAQMMTAEQKVQMESMLKQLELSQRSQGLELERQKANAATAAAKAEERTNAAEKLLTTKEPGLFDSLNPFSSGNSKEAKEAKGFLTEQMRGGFNYDSIKPGEVYTAPDGKRRLKQ